MTPHTNRDHALLSASGATRWLNCTASPLLEEGVPDESSQYAEEGTLAHELAEIEIRHSLKLLDLSEYAGGLAKVKRNPLYSMGMPAQVAKYTNYVLELYAQRVAEHGAEYVFISIEEKVDFSKYAPEGFGTADIIIVSPNSIDTVDLKYGMGVPVDAEENAQQMLYSLGAIEAYDMVVDIKEVNLNIVQPRLDRSSTWTISRKDLETWGVKTVKPKASKAYAGEGVIKTGAWCQFCKVNATCKALADYNLDLARDEFGDPEILGDNTVIEIYGKLDLYDMWVNAIRSYVFKKALNGKKWNGYKLVHGTSRRSWKSDAEVISALEGAGYKKEEYLNVKPKGIGDISNLMSVDDFNKLLAHAVVKPAGKPTLVPDDDKREEFGIAQAQKDFA